MVSRKKCRYRKTACISAIVTVTTFNHCRNMIGHLTGCETACMAGRAVISNRNFLMKDDTGKADKVEVTVATGAIRDSRRNVRYSRRNVCRASLGILADRHNTIVARITAINDTCYAMIKNAIGKGTARSVAIATIVCNLNRYVILRQAGRRNSMAGITGYTQTRNCRAVVVDKPFGKIRRVMAHRTIGGGYRVGTTWRDGRLTDRVSNITRVAGITTSGQDGGIRVIGEGTCKVYSRRGRKY